MGFVKNTIQEFKRLSQLDFIRNLTTSLFGTGLAQVITIAAIPLITRIYSPTEYGLLGVFNSIATLLIVLSTFSFPAAIVLPAERSKAVELVQISCILTLLFFVCLSLVIFFFGDYIFHAIGISELVPIIFLIPLYVLASSLITILNQWCNRNKLFYISAKTNVIVSGMSASSKIGFGLIHPSSVALVSANTIAGALRCLILITMLPKDSRIIITKPNLSSLFKLAVHFRKFPMLVTPQNILNSAAKSIPFIFLLIYTSPQAVGFYALAVSVLAIPIDLAGNSIMQVFYPRAAVARNKSEDIQALVRKLTIGLVALGIIPFSILVIYGTPIFTFIFGEEWSHAGMYASWMSVGLFFQFINKPAVASIPVLSLQQGLLNWEIISTGIKISTLFVALEISDNPVFLTGVYSMITGATYLYLIVWVLKKSSEKSA